MQSSSFPAFLASSCKFVPCANPREENLPTCLNFPSGGRAKWQTNTNTRLTPILPARDERRPLRNSSFLVLRQNLNYNITIRNGQFVVFATSLTHRVASIPSHCSVVEHHARTSAACRKLFIGKPHHADYFIPSYRAKIFSMPTDSA